MNSWYLMAETTWHGVAVVAAVGEMEELDIDTGIKNTKMVKMSNIEILKCFVIDFVAMFVSLEI